MKYLSVFLFYACSLFGVIIEAQSIDILPAYAEKEMLIIFDIDNTLMENAQELGRDQWFYHQIVRYQNEGYTKDAACDKTLKEYLAVQNVSKVFAAEPITSSIVDRLQKEGYTVMGLTTRGLELSHRTHDQLASIGIDLSKTSPSDDEIHFINDGKGILYRKGVLYTTNTNKGKALFTLLEKIGYKPYSVLFINDKASHLHDVEMGCQERHVPFLGLRYGFLDQRVKNFRQDLADIQRAKFGHILSDEEAAQCLAPK